MGHGGSVEFFSFLFLCASISSFYCQFSSSLIFSYIVTSMLKNSCSKFFISNIWFSSSELLILFNSFSLSAEITHWLTCMSIFTFKSLNIFVVVVCKSLLAYSHIPVVSRSTSIAPTPCTYGQGTSMKQLPFIILDRNQSTSHLSWNLQTLGLIPSFLLMLMFNFLSPFISLSKLFPLIITQRWLLFVLFYFQFRMRGWYRKWKNLPQLELFDFQSSLVLAFWT